MGIKLIVADAHKHQLNDAEVKTEFEIVSKIMDDLELDYKKDTVNMVFLKGHYWHNERIMTVTCVFVNKMQEAIKDLYGELQLKFIGLNAMIAKSHIEFNEGFIGKLEPDEGLLIHLNIPVKGLKEDSVYNKKDIYGEFNNIKVTFV